MTSFKYAFLALALAACSSSTSLTCKPTTCSNSSSSYQICVDVGGAVTYSYGASTCQCSQSDQSACDACTKTVAAYCAGQLVTGQQDMKPADLATSSAPDLSSCSGGSSCSIVGTFTNTLQNGAMASITTSGTATIGNFVLTIMSSSSTTTINGDYEVCGNDIILANTSSSISGSGACIGERATYTLTYSNACGSVLFTKVADTCTGRIGDANGATLTRSM